jgi:phosphonatase-like hydrolase
LRISRRRSIQTLAGAVAFVPEPVAARGTKPRRNGAPAIRLVVLDVGGTIIEERGDVPETLRAAFANHGITVSPAEIGQWRGASKREIVRRFVDKQTLPAGVDPERLAADNAVYQTVPPIAGAEDAIRMLRESGYLVATTTGFDRQTTTAIFRRLGWEKYFVASVSSDDVVLGRPSPYMIFHAMESARVNRVAEVIAVGDTPLDLQAGSNAGLGGVVGVLSGASKAEQLRREPHTHILPSVADLPALVDRI